MMPMLITKKRLHCNKIRRYLNVPLFALLILFSFPFTVFSKTKLLQADVQDHNLKQCIQNAINKNQWQKAEQVTEVECKYAAIKSLKGIEQYNNLEKLDVYNNEIAEISPLQGLTNLRALNLKINKIDNIEKLNNLVNLRTLGLSNLNFNHKNGDPLAVINKFRQLKVLNLASNQLSNLSALVHLNKLETLELQANKISDLSKISQLKSLTYLSIKNNNISDISPLAKLPKLNTLYLSGNQSLPCINIKLPTLQHTDILKNCQIDTDKDGIYDQNDNCRYHHNKEQVDTDKDGKGNVCDPDADGNGLNDKREALMKANSISS